MLCCSNREFSILQKLRRKREGQAIGTTYGAWLTRRSWRLAAATRQKSSRDVTTWLRDATEIITRRDDMTARRDRKHHVTWRHDCATRPKSSRDVTTWLWGATEIITRHDETDTRRTGLRPRRRHRNDDSPRRRTTATRCERHACATRRDDDGTWNDFATTSRTCRRTDDCPTTVRKCSGKKLAAVTPQRRHVGPHQSRHAMNDLRYKRLVCCKKIRYAKFTSKFARRFVRDMNIRPSKEDISLWTIASKFARRFVRDMNIRTL